MICILHIITDTNIGGGGRSLLSYLQSYDRTRYQVEVALPRGSALVPSIQALEVPFHEIDAMADRSLDRAALAPLRALIRAVNPLLVHTHGSLTGRIAARLEGRKVIYTRHCAFPPRGLMASPPGRLFTRGLDGLLSDGVLAIGPSARESLTASGIPDRKIHVLFNGVPPLPAPTAEERAACRAGYGFSPDDFVVGILARVEEYKGHRTVLLAVEQLLHQGRPVRLLVAGEGGYLPQLMALAKHLPPGTVIFPGFIQDVEQALWAMDVQVNASYESETSSLSLLEGMSMGLPAVVSDCGGNPFLIQNGKNGLVFPRQDAQALCHHLAQLMDDRALMAQMGQAAITIFQAHFTSDAYAKHIETVYEDVLKGAFS